ncbi:hypothetical protein ACOMHN_049269 [Nucella lapillus]
MADNMDHDTATLDGRGTFHGMGIIASVTPGVKAARRVPRRDVSLKDIKAIGQIKIHFFRASHKARSVVGAARESSDEGLRVIMRLGLWDLIPPLLQHQ